MTAPIEQALPPLPEPRIPRRGDVLVSVGYTAEQMRDYAIAALEQSLREAPQGEATQDERILEIARQLGDEDKHCFTFNKDGPYSVLAFARAVLDARSHE